MKKSKSLTLAFTVLVMASLACSVTLWDSPQAPVIIQQPQQQPQAQNPVIVIITATDLPSPTPTSTSTVTPTFTPTATPTATATQPAPAAPQDSYTGPRATAKEAAPCLSVPGKAGELMDTMPKGYWGAIYEVFVSDTSVTWYRVQRAGFTCWVRADYVIVSGDAGNLQSEYQNPAPPSSSDSSGFVTVTLTNRTEGAICRALWYLPGDQNPYIDNVWEKGDFAKGTTKYVQIEKRLYDEVRFLDCKTNHNMVGVLYNFVINEANHDIVIEQ